MNGTVIIGVLLALTTILAANNWRRGFLMILVVGFLQDPARKLTEGEPAFFVVTITAALALVFVFVFLRAGNISLSQLIPRQDKLKTMIVLFIVLVVIQSLHTFLAHGSLPLTALGLLFYFAPLPALWLAFLFPRNALDVQLFIKIYLAFVIVLALTVFLSWVGVEGVIFKEIGEGLIIFDRFTGEFIDAHGGFMRTPEITAWHLGTGACLALTYAISFNKKNWFIWMLLAGVFLFCGLLTGRRKMIMEIFAFIGCFAALSLVYRSGSARKAILGSVFLVLTLLFLIPQFEDDSVTIERDFRSSAAKIDPYLNRGMSTFGDAGERMKGLGLASIVWAYNAGGFFGMGAGTGAQGAQHFAGGSILGGAAEGGLGRITGELGVPGLILILSIMLLAGLYLLRIVRHLVRLKSQDSRLAIGLISFMLANFPIFIAASQVFGDPFVLFMMACSTGFVLRIGKSMHQNAGYRQPVSNPAPVAKAAV